MASTTLSLVALSSVCVLLMHPAPPSAQTAPPHAAPPKAGPWNNSVVVDRVAVDGAAGAASTLATFTGSDVASIARMKDGRLAVAFQGYPPNDKQRFDRAAVRFSSDEGRTWTAAEPIVVDNLDAGLAPPFDPTLVALPDGRIRLYFISYMKSDALPTATAVYSAVSADGVRYAFEPGARFTVDGRIVLDASAALHDGVFHLIVPDNGTASEFLERRERGEPVPGGNGYHAVSTDGLVFERAADLPISPANNRWWGNLLSDGAQLLFFGTGPGPWPLASTDGLHWAAPAKPLAIAGVDPSAIKLRDGAWLLLSTKEPSGTAPAADRTKKE